MNEQEKAQQFNENLDHLLDNQAQEHSLEGEDQADLETAGRLLSSDFSSASRGREALHQRLLETYQDSRRPAPARSSLRLVGGLAAALLLLVGFSWFIRVMVANLPDGRPASAPVTAIPQGTTDFLTATPPMGISQATPAPAKGEITYTVQAGDTCLSIAFAYSISAASLVEANDLPPDCSGLFVGQVLRIPTAAVTQAPASPAAENELTYTVQEGDTCLYIAFTYSIPVASLVEANDLPPDCSGLFVGQVLRIPTPQVRQSPTPAPGAPISLAATSDQIIQHLRQGRSRWSSLWVDALTTTRQKNETLVDREQAWLSPGASRWMSGQQGSTPALALICTQDECTEAGLPARERRPASSSTGIPSLLEHLLYPENFTFRGGEFLPMREEMLLGRETLVVEWLSPSGQREDRLWVDVETGLVLRWQHLLPEYADASGRVTPQEIQLTGLALNPKVPASIRWTYNLDTLDFEPGPALEGFDASTQPLMARVTLLGEEGSGQEHFAYDLYAQDYYVGTLDTGQVSGGWCDRSPDGRWLAWNYGLGGNPSTLQLIRLEDSRQVVEAIPSEELGEGLLSPVSFSPASDRLAFFACLQAGCGVYIYRLESGELRYAPLPGTGGPPPVWKPDGSQLAVLAGSEGESRDLVILDASTLDVVYRGTFDARAWQPAPGAPILTWGVSLPRSVGGFARCGAVFP